MDRGIAVADGQCMMIVEQGKFVEFCAEPGEFTYDSSTEPSIFSGSFGESVKQTFRTIGKRFTFGGDTAKDQRVYYFNTKEFIDNKFGMTFKNSEKKNWRTLRATSIDKFNDLEEAAQKALRDTHYDTKVHRRKERQNRQLHFQRSPRHNRFQRERLFHHFCKTRRKRRLRSFCSA